MRDKHKREPRPRKAVGSDPQSLLQAAAGTGFIGFSAFQSTPPSVSPSASPPAPSGGDKGSSRKGTGHSGNRGRDGSKSFKASPGAANKMLGSGQVLPPHYSGGDSELAVVSKRLSKRDVTTKIKALAELREMCRLVTSDANNSHKTGPPSTGSTQASQNERSATVTARVTSVEALGGFAPHWVFLYHRLSTEGDRRTREAANTTLLCMMKANRKAFQPLLRSLMGPWCCSQADTAGEVAAAAREAFESVFQEVKRVGVLGRCSGGILRHIGATLKQTPAMLEEPSGCTKEEAAKRSERLTVSALSALANYMEVVDAETNEKLSHTGEIGAKDDERPIDDNDQSMTYWSVVNEDLWRFLEDPRVAVRRMTYALVSSCCRQAPGLLRPTPPQSNASSSASGDSASGHDDIAVAGANQGSEGGAQNQGQHPQEQGMVREGGEGDGAKTKRGEKGVKRGQVRVKVSRVATPGLLVKLLSEKDEGNQREAWQAVLLLTKEFQNTWRTDISAERVLPTLLVRLRKGAFLSTAGTCYPCLLPFLASLSVEALLAPADTKLVPRSPTSTAPPREAKPFCIQFLEDLWAPIEALLAAEGGIQRVSWLIDVASAVVECIAFLLLKLPSPDVKTPSSIEIIVAEEPSRGVDVEPALVSAAATEAAAFLVRAIRSFGSACQNDSGGSDMKGAFGTSVSPGDQGAESLTGSRGRLLGTAERSAIAGAIGRALGQLHLGAQRDAGAMGAAAFAAGVWEALLKEGVRALGQRRNVSPQHVELCWVGEVLVHAVEAVNAKCQRSSKPVGGAETESGKAAPPTECGGVFDLCRSLFRHCVACIEDPEGRQAGAEVDGKVVDPRDAPLISFMSSMARVLGLRGCLVPTSSTTTPERETDIPEIPIVADVAGLEFYVDFAVPRLAATMAEGGNQADTSLREGGDLTPGSVAVMGLRELAAVHLQESDRKDEDFRLLVTTVLQYPAQDPLEAVGDVLCLVPQDFSGDIPELEEAIFDACGLRRGEVSSSSFLPSALLSRHLQRCLGVWDDRQATLPFISSSAVAQLADAAVSMLTQSSITGTRSDSRANLDSSVPVNATPLPNRVVALAVVRGLLDVIAVRPTPPSCVNATPARHAMRHTLNVVIDRRVTLLLAAFRGRGIGGDAEKCWRDKGASTLQGLVESAESVGHFRGVWESFVDEAVEHTRRVMEGGSRDDDNGSSDDAGDADKLMVEADAAATARGERAAVLATTLIELESVLPLQSPSVVSAASERNSGGIVTPENRDVNMSEETSETISQHVPVLWRLGLTRPDTWRKRREEALAHAEDAGTGPTASTVARQCFSSRWGRRWACLSLILDRLPSQRARLAFITRGIPASEAVAGKTLQEIITAGVCMSAAIGSRGYTRNEGVWTAGKKNEMFPGSSPADLPPGLSIPLPLVRPAKCSPNPGSGSGSGGGRGPGLSGGLVGESVFEDFGVGFPSWRSCGSLGGISRAVAAGVSDATMTHLGRGSNSSVEGSRGSTPGAAGKGDQVGLGPSTTSTSREGTGSHMPTFFWHPFLLLLPKDLWRHSFQPSVARKPSHEEQRRSSGRLGDKPGEAGSPLELSPRGHVLLHGDSPKGATQHRSHEDFPEAAGGCSGEDVHLHALLLSAMKSAADAMAAEEPAEGAVSGEAAAWYFSCLAEVAAGLVSSVVGDDFAMGLRLGTEANKIMAIRCGAYRAPVPSPADLIPFARTLYTREGHAVTIVTKHDDDAGGEPYYTVRPADISGSTKPTWHEKQTVLDRLFLSKPEGYPAGTSPGTFCPWLVKPAVSASLADILMGPLFTLEASLRHPPRRSPGESGVRSASLQVAAAAALRSCASVCVRAALLCGPGMDPRTDGVDVGADGAARWPSAVWEEIGPKVVELRDWWASAAVKSGSSLLYTARTGFDGSGEEPALMISLSTAVLSGFFSGTPLIPSDEPAMKLLPSRLEGVLVESASGAAVDAKSAATGGNGSDGGSQRGLLSLVEGSMGGAVDANSVATGGDCSGSSSGRGLLFPPCGWRRAQALGALLWFRDTADASCMVHVCPSQASVEGELSVDMQASTEAALVALVAAARQGRWGGGALDIALMRACSGLFATEAARVLSGKGASLKSEAKAATVSWAISKFLMSGVRLAAGPSVSSAPVGEDEREDNLTLCLESARLLTAVAWDGRKGWGGDGTNTSITPARTLVAGPREASQVWASALTPGVWRGLHAAVVGAVTSPTIQMCAFEVLEAAAIGWDCGKDKTAEDEDEVGEDEVGEENHSEAGDKIDSAEATEESIVSRLARALGGWGLASLQGGDQVPNKADGSGDGAKSASEGEEEAVSDDELPSADAVQEEAQEQQENLELIARCFPEDLLLAVEALPKTIDSLANNTPPELRHRADSCDSDDSEEEDEENGDDLDGVEDEDNEAVSSTGGQGRKDGKYILPTHELPVTDETVENATCGDDDDVGNAEAEHLNFSQPRQPNGRSRRRRLRRRRSETAANRGLDSSASGSYGNRRGGRLASCGPSLTAPFLTWLLWLEHCRRASEDRSRSRASARAFVARAGALGPILEACCWVLREWQKGISSRGNTTASKLGPAQAVRVSRLDPTKQLDLARLALAVYFRTMRVFPALTRSWWTDDCPRGLRVWAAEFTQKHVSPALIQVEAEIIANATARGLWDEGGEMTVRASASSRQVVASYVKEECTLEACIQLPPEYPLRSVDVTCTRRMGVSENRWRKWVLQIVTLLALQDGSVLDAVMLWKRNVDKEFEGIEPCVICYGILHPKDMALPHLSCKTCKNRFHSTCLYKWFHTSHKSKCPICQQTWA